MSTDLAFFSAFLRASGLEYSQFASLSAEDKLQAIRHVKKSLVQRIRASDTCHSTLKHPQSSEKRLAVVKGAVISREEATVAVKEEGEMESPSDRSIGGGDLEMDDARIIGMAERLMDQQRQQEGLLTSRGRHRPGFGIDFAFCGVTQQPYFVVNEQPADQEAVAASSSAASGSGSGVGFGGGGRRFMVASRTAEEVESAFRQALEYRDGVVRQNGGAAGGGKEKSSRAADDDEDFEPSAEDAPARPRGKVKRETHPGNKAMLSALANRMIDEQRHREGLLCRVGGMAKRVPGFHINYSETRQVFAVCYQKTMDTGKVERKSRHFRPTKREPDELREAFAQAMAFREECRGNGWLSGEKVPPEVWIRDSQGEIDRQPPKEPPKEETDAQQEASVAEPSSSAPPPPPAPATNEQHHPHPHPQPKAPPPDSLDDTGIVFAANELIDVRRKVEGLMTPDNRRIKGFHISFRSDGKTLKHVFHVHWRELHGGEMVPRTDEYPVKLPTHAGVQKAFGEALKGRDERRAQVGYTAATNSTVGHMSSGSSTHTCGKRDIDQMLHGGGQGEGEGQGERERESEGDGALLQANKRHHNLNLNHDSHTTGSDDFSPVHHPVDTAILTAHAQSLLATHMRKISTGPLTITWRTGPCRFEVHHGSTPIASAMVPDPTTPANVQRAFEQAMHLREIYPTHSDGGLGSETAEAQGGHN